MPTVSHKLTRPGGAAMADETVHIRLLASTTGEAEGFVASTQTGILSEHKTRTDSTGTWSVALTANALITPANTVYQVIQPGLAGGKVTEHFIVPNGAGPYWLGDILAEAPGMLASAALSLHEAAADPHPAYLTVPEADAAYAPVPTTVTTNTAQLITGLKTVSPSSASAVGLIIQGVVGQSGDLLQTRDSAGARLTSILATGALRIVGDLAAADSAATYIWNQPNVGPTIAGFQFQVRTGATPVTRFTIDQNGGATLTGTGLVTAASGATNVPLYVRGAPLQTADFLQVQNSASTVLVRVTSAGVLTVGPLSASAVSISPDDAFGAHIYKQTGVFGIRGDGGVALNTGNVVRLLAGENGVVLGNTSSLGGGSRVVGINNASTVPTTNPTGGGVLYAEGGALKWRGSSGTVTTMAAA